MIFTDTHSGSLVCTPTRYGVLTGRYCWRTRLQRRVVQGSAPCLISEDRPTVASFLKQQGYDTAIIGKWHLNFRYLDPDSGKKYSRKNHKKSPPPWELTFPMVRFIEGSIFFTAFTILGTWRRLLRMTKSSLMIGLSICFPGSPVIQWGTWSRTRKRRTLFSSMLASVLHMPPSFPHRNGREKADWGNTGTSSCKPIMSSEKSARLLKESGRKKHSGHFYER